MLELKDHLFGRPTQSNFQKHIQAWNEVMRFANDEMGMNYATLKKLKGALRMWEGSTYKKFDQNKWILLDFKLLWFNLISSRHRLGCLSLNCHCLNRHYLSHCRIVCHFSFLSFLALFTGMVHDKVFLSFSHHFLYWNCIKIHYKSINSSVFFS